LQVFLRISSREVSSAINITNKITFASPKSTQNININRMLLKIGYRTAHM
jgi:hypothetical protein